MGPVQSTVFRHCQDFLAMLYSGSAAPCPSSTGATVVSVPADGCMGYSREPGANDDPLMITSAFGPWFAGALLIRLRSKRFKRPRVMAIDFSAF